MKISLSRDVACKVSSAERVEMDILYVLKVDRLNYTIMSNRSSLVPFLTGDEDQNLQVKMVKN